MMLLWLALACSGGSTDDPSDDSDATTTDDLVLDDTPIDPNAPVEAVVEFDRELFEGRPLLWHIPENPRGMVWFFHGSDGDATSANLLESVAILNELIEVDIGFVAFSSDDPREWDIHNGRGSNEDLQRIERVRDHLMIGSSWDKETPVFAWGFSNGAIMTGVFGEFALDQGWPIRAISAHNAASQNDEIPTIFIDSENDDTGVGGSMVAAANALEDAGVATESYMAMEGPLDPMRFLRIPNFNADKSQFQFDEIVDWGHIDADGNRITSTDNVEAVVNQISTQSQGWGPEQAGEQLRVVWCTHRIDGRFALEERNFFVAQL